MLCCNVHLERNGAGRIVLVGEFSRSGQGDLQTGNFTGRLELNGELICTAQC
jgi:hypothetical protein